MNVVKEAESAKKAKNNVKMFNSVHKNRSRLFQEKTGSEIKSEKKLSSKQF